MPTETEVVYFPGIGNEQIWFWPKNGILHKKYYNQAIKKYFWAEIYGDVQFSGGGGGKTGSMYVQS